MAAPLVSIVTATYNRAEVLRFTIEALRASTVTDWELIVVGDACTDHTEKVVASFGDLRIAFVNLAVNAGEQSVPNNEGARRATGRYLAFLNHDDLWVRRHLELALDHLRREAADFVSTLTIAIQPDGEPILNGSLGPGYAPCFAAPASSWVMERALFEAAGPWVKAQDTYLAPSQEWLYRAWREGRQLTSLHRPTVLAIQSGNRPGSYAEGAVNENADWARRLRDDPDLMLSLMTRIAVRREETIQRPQIRPHTARAAKNLVRRALLALGQHPIAVEHAIRHKRRGGFIDSLRRTRGLPPLKR